jgi:hypothetical protein
MRLKKILFFSSCLVLLLHSVKGQEMLGSVLGNYAGVNSVQINPSALHNSKTYLDVQFIGTDMFLENNYLYLSKNEYNFLHFFQSGYQWPTHSMEYGTEERTFYSYSSATPKNAFQSVRFNGPGAMLIWGKHAFALTTGVRSVLSLRHVPYDVANFAYLGLNYIPQQNINYQDDRPFYMAEMSWVEIGLSYAYEVYARGFDRITAGISARRLMGYAGAYLNGKSVDYIIPDDSTINVKNMDAEIGLSVPISYTANEAWNDKLFKGGGFGFDFGLTYTRLVHVHPEQYYSRLCAQQYEDYLYRIGISLIDVGAIQFNTHAIKYAIDNKSSYWEHVNHLDFNSVQQMLDTISYKFYGNNKEAYIGDKMTVWLPSALSMQFDYHYDRHWYLNASVILGVPLAKNSLRRPSEIAITPRYETRWFEANLPISLYDWYLPRIGLSLRFYGFTIGTDKLGYFFNVNDFTGMDLYLSIKFFLDKGSCRSKSQKGCQEKSFQQKSSVR